MKLKAEAEAEAEMEAEEEVEVWAEAEMGKREPSIDMDTGMTLGYEFRARE